MATVLPTQHDFAAQAFERVMRLRRLIASVALFILLELSLVGLAPYADTVASATSQQGDIGRQVLILGALGLLMIAPSNARPPMAVPTSILILLGYCLLTCLWAIEPALAMRRLALTTAAIWIVVRSVGDLGAVRTLNLMRIVLVVLLVANFVSIYATPLAKHLATDESSIIDDWRGVMSHKNVAGVACSMTILFFAFDRTSSRMPPWVHALVLSAATVFLVMSNAKTSIGMVVIALAAGFAMQFYNPRHRSMALPAGVTAAGLIVLYVFMYSGIIERILNDPFALTGRGSIWPPLLEYAGDHLLTGSGFGSFWQIGDRSPIFDYARGWVAHNIGSGHNGYLDLLVTIGLPGLVLAVAVLLVWPMIRLLCSLSISRPRRALLCSILVFCAGSNITESTLLDRTAVVEIFLVIAVVLIHRLSDQSAGAHQYLRERMIRLATRNSFKAIRSRIATGDWSRPGAVRDAAGTPEPAEDRIG
ncbi:O-antigen ligase [Novosphingobium fluoreni]|uniref:O-antigen ligase n=1 Tax=Novosphingobium fluoreni TaxID=1391222 RepID=A0A7W6FZW5_9SPHN|nr:O-antigen ligase family protein [Novosphingobium fluoreni]MBB3940547.1 O-antigen ligase [Novosphingobium fluoreni]